LSTGISGANPEPIFCGGRTGKGLDGSGYTGRATPSNDSSAVVVADIDGADIAEGARFSSSRLFSRTIGDEAAVPVYAARQII
jgi:hypothetical protein